MAECDGCYKRPGQMVCQFIAGPFWGGGNLGRIEAFVFRYYLCRWCRATESKRKKRSGIALPTVVLEYKTDEEVWREHSRNQTDKNIPPRP